MSDPRGNAVEIKGMDKLRREFKTLDEGLTVELKKLNFEGAMLVARASNRYVPVGDPSVDPHPGLLAKSIRARAGKWSASVTAGSPSVPYAAPIHWGWPERGIAPDKFIYKAFDDETPAVVLLYDAGVKRITEMAFAGGEV